MPEVPIFSPFVAGTVPDEGDLNTNIRDILDFFYGVPAALSYKTSTSSFSHSTWKEVGFGTNLFDTDGLWNATDDFFTIQTSGTYNVLFGVTWDGNNTGSRQVTMRINSTSEGTGDPLTDSNEPSIGSSLGPTNLGNITWEFEEGDTIRFWGIQTSGGSLSTLGGLSYAYAGLYWVGDT